MNRRTFLKSIATTCGAAVVCPGELLKSTPAVVGIDEISEYMLPLYMQGKDGRYVVCTATKCYRKYIKRNRCHNCLWNINDIPTTKLIMRKQKFSCPNPSWPKLVEVPIDYQGKEWPE